MKIELLNRSRIDEVWGGNPEYEKFKQSNNGELINAIFLYSDNNVLEDFIRIYRFNSLTRNCFITRFDGDFSYGAMLPAIDIEHFLVLKHHIIKELKNKCYENIIPIDFPPPKKNYSFLRLWKVSSNYLNPDKPEKELKYKKSKDSLRLWKSSSLYKGASNNYGKFNVKKYSFFRYVPLDNENKLKEFLYNSKLSYFANYEFKNFHIGKDNNKKGLMLVAKNKELKNYVGGCLFPLKKRNVVFPKNSDFLRFQEIEDVINSNSIEMFFKEEIDFNIEDLFKSDYSSFFKVYRSELKDSYLLTIDYEKLPRFKNGTLSFEGRILKSSILKAMQEDFINNVATPNKEHIIYELGSGLVINKTKDADSSEDFENVDMEKKYKVAYDDYTITDNPDTEWIKNIL